MRSRYTRSRSGETRNACRHLPPATKIDTAHELLCATNSGIDAISLNGTPVMIGDAPDSSLTRISIPAGGLELLRLLNAATDAFPDVAVLDAALHDGR